MEVTGGSLEPSGKAANSPRAVGSVRVPEIAGLLPPSRRHNELE